MRQSLACAFSVSPFLMKKHLLLLLLLLSALPPAVAQPKTPADLGYRYLQTRRQRDPIQTLVLSKKGEELQRKPVFFFA